PVSYKDVSGKLCQWRIAQLHMAHRAPSLFIMRVAQNRELESNAFAAPFLSRFQPKTTIEA
ncbi:hypothetical protein A2U01_0076245, partial [Trifolium medium]|nr:hypothetical protein [Trifolium medium]